MIRPTSPMCRSNFPADLLGVSSTEHGRALGAFGAKMTRFPPTRPLPLQIFILNKMRFALSSDVCGAFDNFGWICAQFRQIATSPNVDVGVNPFGAMKYGDALSDRTAALARDRAPCIDYFATLSAAQFEFKREN